MSPKIEVQNGIVLIGSDLHLWPNTESITLKGFKRFIKDLKPVAVILNGDVLDFPQISRHPPLGWEKTPTPAEEIEEAQHHLHEITQMAPKGCRTIWTLGNHDARFETRLATIAKEYKNIKGLHLWEHFTRWERGWSCKINDDVLVKHRFKGGAHATYNNALHAGITTITGHLHSAAVRQITDMRGTRWGVDTGCMADANHAAFEYCEDNPRSWVSGFGVFTFKDGNLLWPELVTKFDDGHLQWRGKIVRI